MTDQPDMHTRILAALGATRAAAAAGDQVAADSCWREYVGLLELSMGRTGSSARLTPDPKLAHQIP